MTGDPPSLGVIQRWMQAVLTHPDGVAGGMRSPEARGEIEVGPDELGRVLTRSRALSAADRLGVYANAYYARLLECLREEFPALVHTLGQDVFDGFAVDYLQAHPPKSYTLQELGSNFPKFLAETCPADENPAWAAFLIDLASLERVYNEVFDGPGVEGRQLLTADHLLALPPDRWPYARLVLADGFRLVELRSPVHEYITSIRRNEEPSPPNSAETLLAVHRRDYVVRRHPLLRPQYVLLRTLLAGESIGTAIGRAAELHGPDLDVFAAGLRAWFCDWAAEGFFLCVELPS
jgi:hypothetical protein